MFQRTHHHSHHLRASRPFLPLALFVVLLLLMVSTAFAQEWQSFQLTHFLPTGEVRQCGSVADSLGNLHHYVIGCFGNNGEYCPLYYLRTDFYGHILTDTVRVNSFAGPGAFPIYTSVLGDGAHSWCVFGDWIYAHAPNRALYLTERGTQGEEILPPAMLGPDGGYAGVPSWDMDAALRMQDSTIHVVGNVLPFYYYRFTTDAETLQWHRPIDGRTLGVDPKVAVGPDGAMWAAMRNGYSSVSTEILLVRFGEDTSQTVFHPFAGTVNHWGMGGMSIDSHYNFHFLVACDTATLAYARLDSNLVLQEWRTLEHTSGNYPILKADSAGNCLMVWDRDPGLYWAYINADGSWRQEPTCIDPNLGGSSFSIVHMDSNRFAFTFQGAERGEAFMQLRLYTYGFPPYNATPEPHATARTATSLSISPNPFNSTTRISFSLSHAAEVRLCVFDLTGRLVTTLAEHRFDAGEHAVTFDGKSLASGVYFVRAQTAGTSTIRKLVLLK